MINSNQGYFKVLIFSLKLLSFGLHTGRSSLGALQHRILEHFSSFHQGNKNNRQQQVCVFVCYWCKSFHSQIFWYRDFIRNKNESRLSEHTVHTQGARATPRARGTSWKPVMRVLVLHTVAPLTIKMTKLKGISSSWNQVTNLCICRYISINKYALPLDIK